MLYFLGRHCPPTKQTWRIIYLDVVGLKSWCTLPPCRGSRRKSGCANTLFWACPTFGLRSTKCDNLRIATSFWHSTNYTGNMWQDHRCGSSSLDPQPSKGAFGAPLGRPGLGQLRRRLRVAPRGGLRLAARAGAAQRSGPALRCRKRGVLPKKQRDFSERSCDWTNN